MAVSGMTNETTIKKLLAICENHFKHRIAVRKKTNDLVFKRAIFIKICMDIYPLIPIVDIGRALKKNHSTILHGLKIFEEIKDYPEYGNLYETLLKKCKGKLKKRHQKTASIEIDINNALVELRILQIELHHLKSRVDQI